MNAPAGQAPLFGWNGADPLRFPRRERQLLDIVRNHSESEFNRIVLRKNRRDLAVDLCFERRNCIQSLPVANDQTVLEVGSGAGALTGAWADKAAHVVGIELSPERAYVNAVRNRSRNNVELHCGPFDETEQRLAGRTFDVIALIGSLDGAERFVGAGPDPRRRLLERLRPRLAKGGRIVVAAANQFGLKYWAGGGEENPERPFAGLEGCPGTAGGRPLSRAGLAQLAKESGLEGGAFFYPYPDYRFASSLYSDERLPQPGELCFNRFPWDARTMALFHPGQVFDELIRENLFPLFSNSFLAVLTEKAPGNPAPDERRIVFSKFSTKRRRSLQIRTDLLVDGRGQRSIRKLPYAPEGQPHVDGLARRHAQLARLYAGSILVPNRCELRQGAAELEYLEGPSLADGALAALRRGDRAAFLKTMADFFGTVRSFATEEFRPTAEFRATFGNVRLPAGLKSAPVSNIDLILPNVIVRDGRWHVIDYEWTFDFPVPAGYVLYRTLRYLYLYGDWIARQHGGLHRDLYRLAGIERDFHRYKEMEWNFQNHVVPKSSFVEDLVAGERRTPKPQRPAWVRFLGRHLPREATEWLAKAQMVGSDLP